MDVFLYVYILISTCFWSLGLDEGTAEQILTINDNNLERAINYHLEGNNEPTPTLPGPSAHFYPSLPHMPSLGGYDETNERLPLAGTSTATATLPDEDGVRAPIPPKREQMILPEEDNFRYRKRRNITHNVCPLRNFQEETEQQEARLAALADGNQFHFDSNIGWRNGGSEGSSSSSVRSGVGSGASSISGVPITSNNPAKRSRLGDLFRPPTDLSVSGSLQTAREFAKNQNRWLIVNLQDYGQFQSQTLNRDVWSDQHLRSIIKQYFVLWQVKLWSNTFRKTKFHFSHLYPRWLLIIQKECVSRCFTAPKCCHIFAYWIHALAKRKSVTMDSTRQAKNSNENCWHSLRKHRTRMLMRVTFNLLI